MIIEPKKKIPFWTIAIICYILTVLITWSYGNNYIIYASLSILCAIYLYIKFILNKDIANRKTKLLVWLILIVTLLLGMINGDLQSSVMVNMSLIMPFAIDNLNIDYRNFLKQATIVSLINLLVIYIISSVYTEWNSNSLAIMIFCGLSMGMMWFKTGKTTKNKIFSTLYIVCGSTFLFMTGCRNAGIVILACYALLLLPDVVYKNKIIFRCLYIAVLLATILAAEFMDYILLDDVLMGRIDSYTTTFSDKQWGMDSHYEVLLFVKDKIAHMDTFTVLFGSGIKTYHCHNIFYQCVLFYGYVGTALIYLIYIYIFECAYKLFKHNKDIIALSCFILLLGHFMLQVGEVYMLGSEAIALMALLPAAIILQRRNKYAINFEKA